ncbi:ABC transporter permease [Virgibacillus halophilus]|uniref:ABC transporter permease n=1 Tax=Tigheibacillus halophilus TaxID=361280 RepID=UPI00363D712B
MSKFFKLIYNEEIKIYIRKSTWIMYILLAAIVIGMAALTNTFDEQNNYTSDNWKTELQKENKSLQKENEKYMKEKNADDNYMIDFNQEEITKNNYYLEHDIQPQKYGAWQFTVDNAALLMLVSLFTIIIAAGIVANEFRWGTIKLLLIRPISRSTILLSKYVSVLIFALVTMVAVFILSLIGGGLFFGFEDNLQTVISSHGDFKQISLVKEALSSYGYQIVNLVMMTTFAFMISVIFRNGALAIGVAIFLMMSGNSIVGFFSDRAWAKYILFANTDLQQYASGTPFIEGMTLPFSIVVLIVYYIIFMALSWIIFNKRDVAGF